MSALTAPRHPNPPSPRRGSHVNDRSRQRDRPSHRSLPWLETAAISLGLILIALVASGLVDVMLPWTA